MSKHYGAVRWSAIAAVAVFLAAVWFVLFPVYANRVHNGPWPSSMHNLKIIGLADMQYIQDYDERLPARQYA